MLNKQENMAFDIFNENRYLLIQGSKKLLLFIITFQSRLITSVMEKLDETHLTERKFSDGYSSLSCSATFGNWESVAGKRSLHCNWTQHTMQNPCFVPLSAWSLWWTSFSRRRTTPFNLGIFLFMHSQHISNRNTTLKRMIHGHWPSNGFTLTNFVSYLNHSVPALETTQVTESTQCRLWISPRMVYAFFFQHHHHSVLVSNTFILRRSFIPRRRGIFFWGVSPRNRSVESEYGSTTQGAARVRLEPSVDARGMENVAALWQKSNTFVVFELAETNWTIRDSNRTCIPFLVLENCNGFDESLVKTRGWSVRWFLERGVVSGLEVVVWVSACRPSGATVLGYESVVTHQKKSSGQNTNDCNDKRGEIWAWIIIRVLKRWRRRIHYVTPLWTVQAAKSLRTVFAVHIWNPRSGVSNSGHGHTHTH